MVTLADLDITKPDGQTEPISILDNYQREAKEAVKTSFAVEHSLTGPHKFLFGNTASRPAAGNSGRIYFNTQTNSLQRDNGVSWEDIIFFGSRIAVGSYTGSGSGQSITGVGFEGNYVRVIPTGDGNPAFETGDAFGTGESYQSDDMSIVTDGIVSIDADGFTVDTAADVVSVDYQYIVLKNNI